MKSDQFSDWYANDDKGSLAKIVAAETIATLARQLVAMHRPIVFNYRGRFGLVQTEVAARPPATPAGAQVAPRAPAAPAYVAPTSAATGDFGAGVSGACSGCGASVSSAEAAFCLFNKRKFGGGVYCRGCQAMHDIHAPNTSLPSGTSSVRAAPAPRVGAAPEDSNPANKYTCSACPTKVPYAVARFCWGNKPKFGGKVYCRECQPKL